MNLKSGYELFLLLAGLAVAGCNQSTPPAADPNPPTVSLEDLLPKHAQPKLPTMKIYLGPESLDAELALTPMQEQTGMMFRTNIQETDAMLFVLPVTQQANFWMKNCPESISCAYIDPNGAIQEIHHLEHDDTNGVLSAEDNIRFVLETKDGWFDRHNIHPGVTISTARGSLRDTFLGGQR